MVILGGDKVNAFQVRMGLKGKIVKSNKVGSKNDLNTEADREANLKETMRKMEKIFAIRNQRDIAELRRMSGLSETRVLRDAFRESGNKLATRYLKEQMFEKMECVIEYEDGNGFVSLFLAHVHRGFNRSLALGHLKG